MTSGVLQDIALGYQLQWNAQRQVAGVWLTFEALPFRSVNAAHLLAALQSLWLPKAPVLTLSTNDTQLLTELLQLDLGASIQLAVQADLLDNPTLAQHVARARQRGMPLVWQGQVGQTPLPAQALNFNQQALSLSPEQALLALRASLHRQHGSHAQPHARLGSPVQAGQLVDGVPSQVLVKHCLDEQGAAAVIGWPMEDVLYNFRQTRIQPSLACVRQVLQSIAADASMDQVEQQLGQDPVLAYRFLRFLNSAGLGLDRAIDSLRQGLTVLGLSRTATWLRELAPHASQDLDLEPIRQGLALRARFMAQMLDAGESDALRRELFLCGLLSHIDWLLGENMASALRTVPLPTRITEALLSQEGPYWPFLAIASALENPLPHPADDLCAQHAFDLEEVNQTLLRSLAELCTA